MKKILILILILLCFSTLGFAQDGGDERNILSEFYEAGFAYKKGDYSEAINIYENIIDQGFVGGALFYNLANSYFKVDEPGKAILNYERAKIFISRDADVQANEQYVRSLISSRYASTRAGLLMRLWKKYNQSFSSNELGGVLFGLYIIVGLIWIAAIIFNRPKKYVYILIVSFLVLIIVNGAALSGKVSRYHKTAIVIYDAQAKFEPSQDATVHFDLTVGDEILVLKIEDGWAKIKRSDGKIGWVSVKDFEKVSIF